jgi:hypothetical protein
MDRANGAPHRPRERLSNRKPVPPTRSESLARGNVLAGRPNPTLHLTRPRELICAATLLVVVVTVVATGQVSELFGEEKVSDGFYSLLPFDKNSHPG